MGNGLGKHYVVQPDWEVPGLVRRRISVSKSERRRQKWSKGSRSASKPRPRQPSRDPHQQPSDNATPNVSRHPSLSQLGHPSSHIPPYGDVYTSDSDHANKDGDFPVQSCVSATDRPRGRRGDPVTRASIPPSRGPNRRRTPSNSRQPHLTALGSSNVQPNTRTSRYPSSMDAPHPHNQHALIVGRGERDGRGDMQKTPYQRRSLSPRIQRPPSHFPRTSSAAPRPHPHFPPTAPTLATNTGRGHGAERDDSSSSEDDMGGAPEEPLVRIRERASEGRGSKRGGQGSSAAVNLQQPPPIPARISGSSSRQQAPRPSLSPPCPPPEGRGSTSGGQSSSTAANLQQPPPIPAKIYGRPSHQQISHPSPPLVSRSQPSAAAPTSQPAPRDPLPPVTAPYYHHPHIRMPSTYHAHGLVRNDVAGPAMRGEGIGHRGVDPRPVLSDAPASPAPSPFPSPPPPSRRKKRESSRSGPSPLYPPLASHYPRYSDRNKAYAVKNARSVGLWGEVERASDDDGGDDDDDDESGDGDGTWRKDPHPGRPAMVGNLKGSRNERAVGEDELSPSNAHTVPGYPVSSGRQPLPPPPFPQLHSQPQFSVVFPQQGRHQQHPAHPGTAPVSHNSYPSAAAPASPGLLSSSAARHPQFRNAAPRAHDTIDASPGIFREGRDRARVVVQEGSAMRNRHRAAGGQQGGQEEDYYERISEETLSATNPDAHPNTHPEHLNSSRCQPPRPRPLTHVSRFDSETSSPSLVVPQPGQQQRLRRAHPNTAAPSASPISGSRSSSSAAPRPRNSAIAPRSCANADGAHQNTNRDPRKGLDNAKPGVKPREEEAVRNYYGREQTEVPRPSSMTESHERAMSRQGQQRPLRPPAAAAAPSASPHSDSRSSSSTAPPPRNPAIAPRSYANADGAIPNTSREFRGGVSKVGPSLGPRRDKVGGGSSEECTEVPRPSSTSRERTIPQDRRARPTASREPESRHSSSTAPRPARNSRIITPRLHANVNLSNTGTASHPGSLRGRRQVAAVSTHTRPGSGRKRSIFSGGYGWW